MKPECALPCLACECEAEEIRQILAFAGNLERMAASTARMLRNVGTSIEEAGQAIARAFASLEDSP